MKNGRAQVKRCQVAHIITMSKALTESLAPSRGIHMRTLHTTTVTGPYRAPITHGACVRTRKRRRVPLVARTIQLPHSEISAAELHYSRIISPPHQRVIQLSTLADRQSLATASLAVISKRPAATMNTLQTTSVRVAQLDEPGRPGTYPCRRCSTRRSATFKRASELRVMVRVRVRAVYVLCACACVLCAHLT